MVQSQRRYGEVEVAQAERRQAALPPNTAPPRPLAASAR